MFLPIINKTKLPSKKIFDKGGNLTQNTPKRTSDEIDRLLKRNRDYNPVNSG